MHLHVVIYFSHNICLFVSTNIPLFCFSYFLSFYYFLGNAYTHVPNKQFALHHHDPQIFAAREHLEPLMIQYHVNVVLTGHIHAYQRTDYVAYNSTTPTGPMHITIGAGGRKCDAPFKNKEPEKWLMKRDASMYGYGRLVIENRTHAEWRWIPIAPSELHDYNQVKGDEELHLPSLDHDRITIENQYYVHLRLENE